MSIKSEDIQKALDELRETVETLRKGDMNADEALKLYQTGLKQCENCEKILEEKQQQIEICIEQEDN